MYRLRKIIQLVSFLLFTALLFSYVKEIKIPVGIFLEADPLLVLSSIISSRSFQAALIYALVITALTAILGRVFCGFLCPMGSVLDLTDKLFRRRRKKPAGISAKPKYVILYVLLIASLFGIQLTGWLDPISMLVRVFSTVVIPYTAAAVDWIMRMLSGIPFLEDASGYVRINLIKGILRIGQFSYRGSVAILLLFIAILSLGMIAPRLWCRMFCPLGALLGIISRKAPYRRSVSGACNSCGVCINKCPMGAISDNGRGTVDNECIRCFGCAGEYGKGAVKFGFGEPAKKYNSGITRKQFLLSSAAGVAFSLFLGRVNRAVAGVARLIRPPSVKDEEKYLATCVRCGECVKVCPTGTLQQAMFETGLNGLWAPFLSFSHGYCDYECNVCGRVCPVGAIKKQQLSEKKKFIIGKAYFDVNTCLPWAKGENCIVCEEMCPIPEKAIVLKKGKGKSGNEVLFPYVSSEKCIGCGVCEYRCPLKENKGIRIFKV